MLKSREYYKSIIISKNFYSIILLGIVAIDYKFFWANVELSVSVNDACPFQECNFYN